MALANIFGSLKSPSTQSISRVLWCPSLLEDLHDAAARFTRDWRLTAAFDAFIVSVDELAQARVGLEFPEDHFDRVFRRAKGDSCAMLHTHEPPGRRFRKGSE